jgi:hypothetical protein
MAARVSMRHGIYSFFLTNVPSVNNMTPLGVRIPGSLAFEQSGHFGPQAAELKGAPGIAGNASDCPGASIAAMELRHDIRAA